MQTLAREGLEKHPYTEYVWQVDPPEFSNGYLPAVGTLLNGHHQALLGHRSMGDIVGKAVSFGFLSLVLPQVSVCLLICRPLFVAVSTPFPLLPPWSLLNF